MNTVTKMAIGFAMAKGMDAVRDRGGIGSVLGGLTGGAGSGATGSGGLGGLLGGLTGGGAAGSGGAGGLGDMLGNMTGGGRGAAAGGLGGLGALLGGLAGARGGSGGLESLLSQDNPAPTDEPDEEEVATLMIRAMTQAARADGDIDAQERESLLALLREGDPDNVALVEAIMNQPVDAAALASDTPRGLETQVYTMSVNAITPNNQAEAAYLHALAEGLGITPETANHIHDGIGAPRLYS